MLSAIETVTSDDYLVPFRLLPSDLNQVSLRAKQAGLTVNEWVTSAVLFCLAKQPSSSVTHPVPSQPETADEDDDEENPF